MDGQSINAITTASTTTQHNTACEYPYSVRYQPVTVSLEEEEEKRYCDCELNNKTI